MFHLHGPALRGGALALLAAVLFGVSTPLVQHLGAGLGAFSTAALLYAGAAGMGAVLRKPVQQEARLRRALAYTPSSRCPSFHEPLALFPPERLPRLRPAQRMRHGLGCRPAGLLVPAGYGVQGGTEPSARAGARPALHLPGVRPHPRPRRHDHARAADRAFMIDFCPGVPPCRPTASK